MRFALSYAEPLMRFISLFIDNKKIEIKKRMSAVLKMISVMSQRALTRLSTRSMTPTALRLLRFMFKPQEAANRRLTADLF